MRPSYSISLSSGKPITVWAPVSVLHQRTLQLSEGIIRFISRVIMKKMIRKIRI